MDASVTIDSPAEVPEARPKVVPLAKRMRRLVMQLGPSRLAATIVFLIIATLFAFSHLSFQYPVDLMAEGYSRLYDYAAEHPESAEIFQAID